MRFLRTRVFAALSAAILCCVMTARPGTLQAQNAAEPAAVPPATPAPASSLPSMPAPTPATSALPAIQQPYIPLSVPPATSAPPSALQSVPAAAPAKPDSITAVPAASPGEAKTLIAMPPYDPDVDTHYDHLGSTYIPVDSVIYPMALRLYSLGYLDSAFIGLRPWTRRSLLHMLEKSRNDIVARNDDQAMELLARMEDLLEDENPSSGYQRPIVYGLETLYTRLTNINGQPLNDSFHLGQTLSDDYGRPFQSGFNAIGGFSSVNEWDRFSLYVRGEYQHSPAGAGYSYELANQLSCNDEVCPFTPPNLPSDTIPYGKPLYAQNPFRLVEATLSYHILGHEISGGKSDAWLGPALGGAMGWSNNAENIYSFRINRIEPMTIPLVSRLLGPLRYDFFVGSLKGHTAPNSPWVHSEIFSLRPTKNFEFAFQRTVIWGGEGHVPVTLHTFLRSFFSFNDTTGAQKTSSADPGARFSSFTFSYRLPFFRDSVTLYTDSEAHDDVSPISAPRRAAYRPGIYISHLPGLHKMDFRAEGFSTDVSTLASFNGGFMYFEVEQKQGYTNKGFIFGDWVGREAKGGQAWLTYNLGAGEWVQAEFLTKETPNDFVSGGVHQNDYKIDVVKRLRPDIELHAYLQSERWTAPNPVTVLGHPYHPIGGPLYFAGPQHDTTIAAQITWYPRLHTAEHLNGK